MSGYEVWCNHCDVTFPTGTRRCLHCGGRTSPSRLQRSLRELPELRLEGPPPSFAGAPFTSVPSAAELLAQTVERSPVEDFEAAVEEPPGKRSLLRAGMSVVWMILLAAGYLWKSCSE